MRVGSSGIGIVQLFLVIEDEFFGDSGVLCGEKRTLFQF